MHRLEEVGHHVAVLLLGTLSIFNALFKESSEDALILMPESPKSLVMKNGGPEWRYDDQNQRRCWD